MTADVPRMRMFAGPNGSGKSTIKSVIRSELLGTYINPDELEDRIREHQFLDFRRFGVRTSADEAIQFFCSSFLLYKVGLAKDAVNLTFAEGFLHFKKVEVNSYFAAVAADFLRLKLLEQGASFTFETVMSSPDKVALLERAQRLGYRTYLYYIATEDPTINIARVRSRALLGGHPVPEDKIISRYGRSLDLLFDAISQSSRAYIFDNSSEHPIWIAEITDGSVSELKTEQMPEWFKRAFLDKLTLK